MALRRVALPTRSYRSGNSGRRLLVIHTAEGARTIESLAGWWNNPGAQGSSSHVGIDDKVNTVGEYVRPTDTAFTCAEFNGVSENAELCGFARWTASEWLGQHDAMLRNCGAWLAEESARTGIPLVRLTDAAAQGSGRGVCGHSQLGARGGGHSDPGAGFPWDYVFALAKGGAPISTTGDDDMGVLVQNPNNNGWAILDPARGEYRGISSPDVLAWLRDGAKVPTASKPTPAVWGKLRHVGTI